MVEMDDGKMSCLLFCTHTDGGHISSSLLLILSPLSLLSSRGTYLCTYLLSVTYETYVYGTLVYT